jgi:hypothetical protein
MVVELLLLDWGADTDARHRDEDLARTEGFKGLLRVSNIRVSPAQAPPQPAIMTLEEQEAKAPPLGKAHLRNLIVRLDTYQLPNLRFRDSFPESPPGTGTTTRSGSDRRATNFLREAGRRGAVEKWEGG